MTVEVELVFRLPEALAGFLVGDFFTAEGDLVLLTMAEDPLVEVIRLFCDRLYLHFPAGPHPGR